MNKREKYIALELSGEKLDKTIADIRDKLLYEFWSHIPDGAHRDQIKLRLERSILQAFNYKPNEINTG
jgi:hypothetical protein